jgi:E3 ubiquitin-protein ligase DOA10
MSKMVYDPDTFKQTDQCAICLSEFEESQSVSPLPCNIKHYFHTECLEQWMKTKQECPLCRAEITEDALKDFGEHVDELMHEKDDE